MKKYKPNKEKIYLLFSPLSVVVIMCLCYALYGIFPFGTKTAAWCDLNQQTIPLLMNLKDILDGKTSIFFTAYSGGGMNFWGVFFFFLASPFYLAVKFISKQDMSYFVTVLLVLKLAVCAYTCSLYISSAFNNLKKRYVVFSGLVYSFCGFSLMYYQTLIWLDVMYTFPLLIMSIDSLCRNNKHLFYILTLSATVTINYYLSYMVAIYLLIAVPIYVFIRCDKPQRKSASLRFLISSLTAALITAPVWLCTFTQISRSARSISNTAKFIFESPFESLKDKLCVVITCALLFAALPFVTKESAIKKKRVKSNFLLLLLLIIPVFLDPINKIWHFGGYQGFPLRFGYMITFTLIVILCDIFEDIPKCRKSSMPYCILSFLILATLAFVSVFVVFDKKDVLSYYYSYLGISNGFFKTLFILFIFSFSVYTLYFFLLRNKLISNNLFFMLISCVFLLETFVNTFTYVGNSSNNDDLFKNTMSLENIIETSDDLYRVKNEKKYFHVNMIGGLGYNSYAHYTSLSSEKYLFAMKKLGYSSYWMETGSNGGTILTDALLGIKYSIGFNSDFDSYQRNIASTSLLCAAENLICAPAGIILNTPPEQSENLNLTDRYNVQRQLSERFFGSDKLLEKYDYTAITNGFYKFSNNTHKITSDKSNLTRCRLFYNLKIDGHKVLYLDLFDSLSNNVTEPIYNSLRINVNGVTINESYPDKKNNGLLKLGEFENEDADISLTLLKDISVKSFSVFGIDIDQLKSRIDDLKTAEPILEKNKITVNCDADRNNALYLSIPYDDGFTAYLNGSKTKIYNVNDGFCAIKLNEGQNNLKIVFYPKGFRISLVLSALGLTLLILLHFKGNTFFYNKKSGTVSLLLCRYVFWTVIIVVYLIPVIIYTVGLIIRFSV